MTHSGVYNSFHIKMGVAFFVATLVHYYCTNFPTSAKSYFTGLTISLLDVYELYLGSLDQQISFVFLFLFFCNYFVFLIGVNTGF